MTNERLGRHCPRCRPKGRRYCWCPVQTVRLRSRSRTWVVASDGTVTPGPDDGLADLL